MAIPMNFDYSRFRSTSSSFSGPSEADFKFLEKCKKEPKGNFSVVKPLRSTSAFGKENGHCLCEVLKPIIFLGQLFGLVPVALDRKHCRMRNIWISFPSLINICLIVANVLGFAFGAPAAKRKFQAEFSGIEMYTFVIVIVIQFICTILILLGGNCNAAQFPKAWTELHSAVEEIGIPKFKQAKYMVYLLPLYLLNDIMVKIIIYAWHIFSGDISTKEFPFTSQLGGIIVNMLPNIAAGIYVVFLSIITSNFKAINKNLQVILKIESTSINIEKHWNPLLPLQISRYRILHEKLCRVTRLLEKYFGLQILAVFTGTCVAFVCGIYALIIGSQGMAVSYRMNSILIGFAIVTMFAAIRVIVVNWFCQKLMNAGNGTAHILNNFYSETSPVEVNIQVEKFLRKLGDFPVQTKCCNMFELGNSFFSSAASIIVTYVLILIQFRMDDN